MIVSRPVGIAVVACSQLGVWCEATLRTRGPRVDCVDVAVYDVTYGGWRTLAKQLHEQRPRLTGVSGFKQRPRQFHAGARE